jgi:hypothetical protein
MQVSLAAAGSIAIVLLLVWLAYNLGRRRGDPRYIGRWSGESMPYWWWRSGCEVLELTCNGSMDIQLRAAVGWVAQERAICTAVNGDCSLSVQETITTMLIAAEITIVPKGKVTISLNDESAVAEVSGPCIMTVDRCGVLTVQGKVNFTSDCWRHVRLKEGVQAEVIAARMVSAGQDVTLNARRCEVLRADANAQGRAQECREVWLLDNSRIEVQGKDTKIRQYSATAGYTMMP